MLTSNSSTNTDNNTNIQSLYEIEYEKFLNIDIPSVIFLTFLLFVGIVGNVYTLLVYSMSPVMARLTVRIFIMWLSATDLIACVVCIPFEIFDIRFDYTFSSDVACKFFRFLNHAVTLSSGGLLTAIALERYKINNIFQILQSRNPFVDLNIVLLAFVGIAIIFSSPTVFLYGLSIKETCISNITGTDCAVLPEYYHRSSVGLYIGTVILFNTVCCGICVVVYMKILFVICVQMKKERKDREKSRNYKMDISSKLTSTETQQVSTSQLSDVPAISSSLRGNVPTPVKTHKPSKYEKERQLTTSLIVAATVSYLGQMMFSFTVMVKMTNPTLLYKGSIRRVTEILLRTYFINNAANPVVYFLLDNTFRTECLKLYKKTMCAK